jgi:hypothetical protein
MWKYINETVEAVKIGLDVKPDDRVLAICSAGVIPLALLESISGSGNMVAVDINPDQFEVAQQLARLVDAGDQRGIGNLDPCPKNPEYFSSSGRLESIARNLSKLKYLHHDLSQEPDTEEAYTKGYFSNVNDGLFHMGSAFERDALIYVAHHTASIAEDPHRVVQMYSRFHDFDIHAVYDIDMDRTLAANRAERETDHIKKSDLHGKLNDVWRPIVYRKK